MMPDWVKWMAVDESGAILGFKDKPRISRKSSWGMGCNGWYSPKIGVCRLGHIGRPNDWTKTLVKT